MLFEDKLHKYLIYFLIVVCEQNYNKVWASSIAVIFNICKFIA